MKARSKSEWKMAIREEAKRAVKGPRSDVYSRGAYSKQVESGLNELRTKMSEAGDGKAKRVKSELTFAAGTPNTTQPSASSTARPAKPT